MEAIELETKKEKRIVSIWNSIWKNRWYPLLIMGIIFTITLAFVLIYCGVRGGFLNMGSDDIAQYYPYVAAFFQKIKNGTLSLYDKDLFGGTSYFSAAYYIPLDSFTFIAFLLSYIMPSEIAYSIMNFLRPVAGACILYYAFSRKYSFKTAFICGLILFSGGVTETFYIFPVYLGICVYAPLAMLLVDLVIERKGNYYFLLSIYSVIVIFYDFYIAYMLLAFICVYFVVAMHTTDTVSFIGKKSFIKNKEFYTRYLLFFAFLLLGVLMASVILIPSALYIINQTSRNSTFSVKDVFIQFFKNDSKAESYIYFSKKIDGVYQFSFRHYFTQLANIFMPNDPFSLCLVSAGDYVREHASLYATTGGFIYLIFFFMTKGNKEANRLKFWVIFMNVLLLIPLFSVIFGLNVSPYVRWFFIPYFINLYAIALGLESQRESKLSYYIIPTAILFAALAFFIYILAANPEAFIHYTAPNYLFYLLVIPTVIIISLYVIIFVVLLTIKRKNLIFKFIPVLTFLEIIFGIICIFANVDNTNSTYYTNKNNNLADKNNVVEIYNFDEKDGYRININTFSGNDPSNVNVSIGESNFGRFFQSFYNKELNVCLSDIYESTNKSWTRTFNDGYSLLTSPIFNTKYVVSEEDMHLPSKYYNVVKKDDKYYYENKSDMPFIIYEDGYYDATFFSRISNRYAVLFHAYYDSDNDDSYLKAVNYGIKMLEYYEVDTPYESEWGSYSLPYLSTVKSADGKTKYYVYDLAERPNLANWDAYYIQMYSRYQKNNNDDYMYLTNNLGNTFDPSKDDIFLHYNDCYTKMSDYKYLVIKVNNDNENDNHDGIIYGYNYDLYDLFLEEQSKYTNKSFSLEKDTMKISVTMPSSSGTRIIKTGYTYSKEWVLETEGYDTISVDGGFLGIVVKDGIKDVDVTLKFIPEGYSTAKKLTIISLSIYILLGAGAIYLGMRKKKRVI